MPMSTKPRSGRRSPTASTTMFCATSRNRFASAAYPAWHNSYMRLYGALQELGKPFGFHAGFTWSDPSFAQLNRFIGMHALSFAHFNMIHMTNWVLNGIPERFPKLKVIWIESGLAWIPFVMQRLDSEYMMRTSECPLLKRPPHGHTPEVDFTSLPR